MDFAVAHELSHVSECLLALRKTVLDNQWWGFICHFTLPAPEARPDRIGTEVEVSGVHLGMMQTFRVQNKNFSVCE